MSPYPAAKPRWGSARGGRHEGANGDAHHDPRSSCRGVLERFTDGLRAAGHTSEVTDLYAIKFDPVFRDRDVASYTGGDIPGDILELMDLRGRVMNSCRGPLQRWLAERALRGKSQSEIAALIRSRMPKDVLAQQAKVAWADGLAFIAPIHFCAFPAILKGWIDRVWANNFAFGLTSAGWRGDISGRIPLLRHMRALIMTSTIFDKNAYDDRIRDAIGTVSTTGASASPASGRGTRLLLHRHIRRTGTGQALLRAGLPARP